MHSILSENLKSLQTMGHEEMKIWKFKITENPVDWTPNPGLDSSWNPLVNF